MAQSRCSFSILIRYGVLASTSRLHADSFEVARRTGSDSRLRTACKLRLDTEVTECS